jgi:hypothetical protein
MSTKTKPLAGKTITLPVWVRAEPSKYGIYTVVDGFELRVAQYGGTLDDGSFVIAETTVTITVPADFDPVAPMVAGIEAEKAKLTAEFAAAVAKLNRKLSELQAIEFDSEAA